MAIGNVAGLQRRLNHQPVVDAADIGFWAGDNRIHHPLAHIALHNRDALRQRQSRGRAVLFAEVIDKHHWRRSATQRLGHLVKQQDWQQAGIETARADKDQIGFGDGLHRLTGGRYRRGEHQLLRHAIELIDIDFTVNFMAFMIERHQIHRLFRHRNKKSVHFEQVSDQIDRFQRPHAEVIQRL